MAFIIKFDFEHDGFTVFFFSITSNLYFIYSAGHPKNDRNCEQPILQAGCNIINNQCTCETIHTCEESPFDFGSRDECEANLAVMLAHELSDQPLTGKSILSGIGSFYAMAAK